MPDAGPRIRVVHVLDSLGTGGLENGIVNVVSRSSPGFEHVVACLTRSGEMAARLSEGVRVEVMGKPPGNSLRFLRRLGRRLRDLRPDVVHTRNWPGMDAVLAARLAGLRRVVHGEHGWEIGDPAGRSRKRRAIRRWFSRWTREWTCVSRDLERWLRGEVRVRVPVTQIYNGVDTDRFCPPEARPGDGRCRIGIVGRLDPIKDHDILFRAFRDLQSRGVPAELVVVGDGGERPRLETLAGDGIRMLGARDDIPDLLRTFDLFVLPSRNEGISNTILEAMASGLPVVACRVGGNPELVGDGEQGRLVPPGDAEALARALAEYAADPERRRAHGQAARRRVLERFSLDAMTRAYEAVWRRVAADA